MLGYCRICNCRLPETAALLLPSQPAMAQHLPKAEKNNDGNLETVDLLLKQCPDCGVTQLDNQPVPYYREVIRATAFSPAMQNFRRRQFAAFRRRHCLTGKRLLEVGCGSGEYLQCWKEIDVYGMEFSPENCAKARAKGFKIFRGYPGDSLPPGAPYDAFAMFSWLEHLPDLPQVLKNLRDSLNPGAVGLLEVPDFDMICEQNLFSEFVLDHLFYFTEKTLRGTLSMYGFETLRCRNLWHGYILSAEVRRRMPLCTTGFRQAQKKLLQAIKNHLQEQSGTTAIWGAGHQSLALLAMCEHKERISYVVDSAPFKQGHRTPGSGFLIVPPEHLLKDPPGSILIIAGSYNQEIAGQIKKQHQDRFKLACIEKQSLKKI